ncbi:hypothetical protein GALMADRAFT_231735 [Galerina marginata CBS 339.88]|uniref:Uncharacterized protein n=1 Tax=Galerina marginata (strain CBS 339.88) TaxID=685588 RepID=A0A067SM32_GALM3|nr:hypothetical protein GALMADRAFT_231735 [Galerina marginata CBS 339.88]
MFPPDYPHPHPSALLSIVSPKNSNLRISLSLEGARGHDLWTSAGFLRGISPQSQCRVSGSSPKFLQVRPHLHARSTFTGLQATEARAIVPFSQWSHPPLCFVSILFIPQSRVEFAAQSLTCQESSPDEPELLLRAPSSVRSHPRPLGTSQVTTIQPSILMHVQRWSAMPFNI